VLSDGTFQGTSPLVGPIGYLAAWQFTPSGPYLYFRFNPASTVNLPTVEDGQD
jgi:hypothetical protein